jgi:hypothetical protein
MAKRKKKQAARRRRRNPRMLAPAHSGRPHTPEEVRSPTPKEVAAAAHEALKQSRAHLESAETEAWLGAPLKGYFLRVVATLEDMLKMAIVFPEDDFLLFAQAAGLFLPVLGMDWLPEDPRSFTRELTESEREILETMSRGEADNPPDRQQGRWTGLLDMITESVEVFLRFGYVDGLAKCYVLNEALIARLGGPPAPPLRI